MSFVFSVVCRGVFYSETREVDTLLYAVVAMQDVWHHHDCFCFDNENEQP